MNTLRAKGKRHSWRGDMRVVMFLLELYDACLRNAAELLAKAKLLLNHDHAARAFALAYTGWEEVGKAQLVGDYANEMVADERFRGSIHRSQTLPVPSFHGQALRRAGNVPRHLEKNDGRFVK